MSESKLRWGVLSTAKIGREAVIPAIRASHNGELVAVASRDAERASAFATEYGIPAHFGDYEALLASDDVDAVYIPLPNSEHVRWSVRAAQHGKHVLCEKPFALTVNECEEMAAAAEANGVRLMEAFMYRFHPRTERVLELVRAGTVGELRIIRSAFTFPLTRPNDIRMRPELGGGALMDVGCYCVSLSRTVTRAEPVEVQAFATWNASGIDAVLAGTLRFDNGVLAQFDCGFTVALRQSYEIAGTDGTIDVPAAFRPGNVDTGIVERHGRDQPVHHTIAAADEYRLMVEHFADAALHGRPLRYPAADARAGMCVIEGLYRSARDGGRPKRLDG